MVAFHVLRRSPNNRFRGQQDELERSKHEDGIPKRIWFAAIKLTFELVSDDDVRSAVSLLNNFRLDRAEILGDGYDVSKSPCYNFMPHQTPPIQCLEEIVFTPIVKNAIVSYMHGTMSVPSTLSWVREI